MERLLKRDEAPNHELLQDRVDEYPWQQISIEPPFDEGDQPPTFIGLDVLRGIVTEQDGCFRAPGVAYFDFGDEGSSDSSSATVVFRTIDGDIKIVSVTAHKPGTAAAAA